MLFNRTCRREGNWGWEMNVPPPNQAGKMSTTNFTRNGKMKYINRVFITCTAKPTDLLYTAMQISTKLIQSDRLPVTTRCFVRKLFIKKKKRALIVGQHVRLFRSLMDSFQKCFPIIVARSSVIIFDRNKLPYTP